MKALKLKAFSVKGLGTGKWLRGIKIYKKRHWDLIAVAEWNMITKQLQPVCCTQDIIILTTPLWKSKPDFDMHARGNSYLYGIHKIIFKIALQNFEY